MKLDRVLDPLLEQRHVDGLVIHVSTPLAVDGHDEPLARLILSHSGGREDSHPSHGGNIGAVIMKMMSKTRTTSTKGVTLISEIAWMESRRARELR